MQIVKKTVYVIDNNDTFDTADDALGNARLLAYQNLFLSLFPGQASMVAQFSNVFAARNAEILAGMQAIEADLAAQKAALEADAAAQKPAVPAHP